MTRPYLKKNCYRGGVSTFMSGTVVEKTEELQNWAQNFVAGEVHRFLATFGVSFLVQPAWVEYILNLYARVSSQTLNAERDYIVCAIHIFVNQAGYFSSAKQSS